MRADLEEFAAKVGAEIDLRATRAAVKTTATPRGKGGFLRKAPPPVEQHALITDRHLADRTLRAGEQINSIYRLDSIDVSEFKTTLIEDVGVEITGIMVGGSDRGTAFLGLDHGAGRKRLPRDPDRSCKTGGALSLRPRGRPWRAVTIHR